MKEICGLFKIWLAKTHSLIGHVILGSRYWLASLFLTKHDKVILTSTTMFIMSGDKKMRFGGSFYRSNFNPSTVPQFIDLKDGLRGGLLFADPLSRVVVYKELEYSKLKKRKVKT